MKKYQGSRQRFDFVLLGIGLWGLWSLFPGALSVVGAEVARERESAITRELKCIQDSLQNSPSVEWAEVCYTGDSPDFVRSRREAAINAAMNRVELTQQRSREQPAVSSPEVLSSRDVSPSAGPVAPRDIPPAERPEKPNKIFFSRNPRAQYEMGLETSRIRYVEPGLMRDKGAMSGIFLNYTYRTQENQKWQHWRDSFTEKSTLNMFRLEGKYSRGEVDYSSSGTGTISHVKDHMLELRGLAGYDMPVSDSFLVTPFSGFGYRYLNDDKGGLRSSTGHYGYERESQYFYLPLGLEGSTKFASRWQLVLRLEYDYLLRGRQKSHMEDVAPGFETLVNEQRRGFGYRGAVRFMYVTPYVDVFAEPFIRCWDLKDSKTMTIQYGGIPVGMGTEPRNKSTEYGLRLGVNY